MMRRLRAHIAIIGLVGLLAGSAGCSQSTPASTSATQGPNILFLLTDDLSLDEISVMPNLKRLLIDQGVSFSNYFVNVSLCCPSRATTLRGQYSHNTGIETNGGPTGGFTTAYEKGIEKSTIATWLQDKGYRTALIGKYLNGYPNGAPATYVPPGWDEWDSASHGGSPYGEFDYTLNENGKLVHYGHDPKDYGTDVYTAKAVDFVTKAAEDRKPFFTYLAVYAPHQPATPAPRHESLFPGAKAPRTPSYNEADVSDKPGWVRSRPLLSDAEQADLDGLYRKRLQSLQAVDDAIAKLVGTLKANHQLDNTYFVFTSDNGFHLGQHRLPAGKSTAFEEDIHLPLIVRGPGVPAGEIRSEMTGNVDLAQTFAALAHAPTPNFVDGRSFAPLLRVGAGDWRHAYLVEHGATGRARGGPKQDPNTLEPADPDQGGASSATRPAADGKGAKKNGTKKNKKKKPSIPQFAGVRTARYTYVEYVTGDKELYDRRSDPNELRNIAATADPKLVDQLAQRLHILKTCRAAQCRAAEDLPIA